MLFKVNLGNLLQLHNTNCILILLQGAHSLTGNHGDDPLWTSRKFRSTCAVPQDLQISLCWGQTQNNLSFHLAQRDPLCSSSSLTESKKAISWWDNDARPLRLDARRVCYGGSCLVTWRIYFYSSLVMGTLEKNITWQRKTLMNQLFKLLPNPLAGFMCTHVRMSISRRVAEVSSAEISTMGWWAEACSACVTLRARPALSSISQPLCTTSLWLPCMGWRRGRRQCQPAIPLMSLKSLQGKQSTEARAWSTLLGWRPQTKG